MNLLELLDNPNSDIAALLRRAVTSWVTTGDPGTEFRAWRTLQRQTEQRLTSHWELGANDAQRRDGVEIQRNQSAIPNCHFVACFAPRPGCLRPVFGLSPYRLEEACQEVDRRWPMADWWTTIDNDDRPRRSG